MKRRRVRAARRSARGPKKSSNIQVVINIDSSSGSEETPPQHEDDGYINSADSALRRMKDKGWNYRE